MISKEQYEAAQKIIDQYNYENRLAVYKGAKLKCLGRYRGGNPPKWTKGKTYTVEGVRTNFNFHKLALSIRDDEGKIRWYSSNSIDYYFEKI